MSIGESEGTGLIGTLAGRYRIISELGKDDRRALYEAEHVDGKERVTLGVVKADATPPTERLRKAEKLRSVRQPGLVGVLDVGKLDSGDLWVATERAVGTPLRTLITGTLLDQRRALAIVRQVLEALAAAHAAGAIHGDIKPETINITVDGRIDHVKLTDFGVAALTGATKAGDARYCAPEVALGAVDGRADLYSTGAVLYELLTGHPPFFAPDASGLRRLHAYAPMQTLAQRAPEVSYVAPLEDVVAKALAKKRDARFQTADEMIQALDRALDAVEKASPPPPEPESPRRRHPHDSLLLLAKDLMPAAKDGANEVVVPVNVGRQVPELPLSMRARKTLRLDKLSRRQKQIIGGGAAVLLVLVIAIIAWPTPASRNAVREGRALVAKGKEREAIALLERELTAHPANVAARAELGNAQLSLGHERDALTSYDKGIAASPALAADPDVVASLGKIAGSHDPLIAIDALELVAERCGVQGDAVITNVSATGQSAKARARALELAHERGLDARVDRVASWLLDLEQATTCEQRRAAITKLGDARDKRAVPALQEAEQEACVARDATAAIQRITGVAKSR